MNKEKEEEFINSIPFEWGLKMLEAFAEEADQLILDLPKCSF